MKNKTTHKLVFVIVAIAIAFFAISCSTNITYAAEEKTMFDKLADGIAGAINSVSKFLNNQVQAGIKMTNPDNATLVTIDDIVFDEFADTRLAFFKNEKNGKSGTLLVENLRDAMSNWYNRFVVITIAGYLAIFIYIVIRMIISSTGKGLEEQKRLLTTWIEGILILFLMPYGMKYIIEIEHGMAQMIGESRNKVLKELNISDYNSSIPNNLKTNLPSSIATEEEQSQVIAFFDQNAFEGVPGTNFMAFLANKSETDLSIANSAVYFIAVCQFIVLVITYYKRLFMVGFLITIFPIVMLLYPIDKANDNHAQSFSLWMKEFTLNVFTQAIHAVIYVFVIGAVFAGSSNGDWLLSMVRVAFLFKGEELLKQLLGAGSGNTTTNLRDTAVKTMATMTAVRQVTSRVGDNFVHAKQAIRAGRRQVTEKKIAKSMRNGRNTFSAPPPIPTSTLPLGTGIEGFDPSGASDPTYMSMVRAVQTINGAGTENNPEAMADALQRVRQSETSTDARIIGLRNQLRLSKEQRAILYQTQDDLVKDASKIDTKNPNKYSTAVEEVTKELEIHLEKHLPDESDATRRLVGRAIRMNALRDAQSPPPLPARGTPTMAQKRYSERTIETEAKEAIEERDKFIEFASAGDVHQSTRERRVSVGEEAGETPRRRTAEEMALDGHRAQNIFVATGRTQKLSQSVEADKERILDSLEHNRKYKGKFDDLSEGEKRNLVESLAVLRDIKSRMGAERTEENPSISYGQYDIGQIEKLIRRLSRLSGRSEAVGKLVKEQVGADTQDLGYMLDMAIVRQFTHTDEEVSFREAQERRSQIAMEIETGREAGRTDLADLVAQGVVAQAAEDEAKERVIRRRQEIILDIKGASENGELAPSAAVSKRSQEAYNNAVKRLIERQEGLVKRATTEDEPDPLRISNGSYSKVTIEDATRIEAELDKRRAYEGLEDASESVMDTATAEAMFGEIAEARREKTIAFMEDSLSMTKEMDDKAFEPTYQGLTAKEHLRAARANRIAKWEELARTTTTTTGVLFGGVIGGAVGIGLGDSNSMTKEVLVGAGAGMALGDTLGEKVVGEKGKKSKGDGTFRKVYDTIKVENPYDGSITEIDLQKSGAIRDNSQLKYIGPDVVLSAYDERLKGVDRSIKYNIDNQLLTAARKNRLDREKKAAQRRSEAFRNAIGTNRNGSSGGSNS